MLDHPGGTRTDCFQASALQVVSVTTQTLQNAHFPFYCEVFFFFFESLKQKQNLFPVLMDLLEDLEIN